MKNKKFSWKNERWVKPYLAQYKWNFILAIFLGVVMFFCGGALMFYAGYTIVPFAIYKGIRKRK